VKNRLAIVDSAFGRKSYDDVLIQECRVVARSLDVIAPGKSVATFPAHVTEQSTRNTQDAYGSSAEPDGSRSLTAIYIGGKRTTLELEQKESSTQSSTPEPK
jgi:hypothetical protein